MRRIKAMSEMAEAAYVAGSDWGETVGYREYPLSGEWAGESIIEIGDRYGLDLCDPSLADAFEDGFYDATMAEAIRLRKVDG